MRLVLLAPALLLAACDSGPKVELKDATPEEVAKEMKKSGLDKDMRQPGLWRYTTTIIDVSAPNISGGMSESMKKMMAGSQNMERCVTEEEVENINDLVVQNEANCKFENYTLSGGKISGKAKCEKDGAVQSMVMEGTYTSRSSDMTMSTTTSGGPMGDMTVKMNIKSERIGDCKG